MYMQSNHQWTQNKIKINYFKDGPQDTHSAFAIQQHLTGQPRQEEDEMNGEGGRKKSQQLSVESTSGGGKRNRDIISLQIHFDGQIGPSEQSHTAVWSESEQGNHPLGAEPPGSLEWEALGSSPVFSPAGQTLRGSGQQPSV